MRVLIITSDDLRRFHWHRTADLGLAWALERRGVDWVEVQPGPDLPELDDIDAVLSWWGKKKPSRLGAMSRPVRHPLYPWKTPLGAVSRFMFDVKVEKACARHGIPVINPLSRRTEMRHSHCLDTWRAHGIPCARCQRYQTLDEIELRYPMVLRTDGGTHMLQDSTLAQDRAHAERLVAARAETGRAPFNLAIEFIENVYPDGRYRKRRSFVIGDRVIPRQHMLSKSWKVKLENVETGEPAVSEDRRFMADGEEDEDLVRRAAQLLGPEVVALDYTRRADGSYLFWEGNPRWGMAGLGKHKLSVRFRAATGRSEEECREEHVRLGEAIVDLVTTRVREAAA